jgi:uncharacterized protein
MLGLSFGKLLVLILLVLVVWYGFKYVQRVEDVRRMLRRELERRQGKPQPNQPIPAEDLVKCARCGAYVATGSRSSCGRADCPWTA